MRIDPGTFTAVLAFVTFIFAVIGVAGTWRSAKSTSALNSYRDTAKAWEDKSNAQTMQLDDLRADANGKDRRIAELEGKVTVLQETLTGRVAWDAISAKAAEAVQLIGETRAEIRQLHELLEARP